MEMYFNRICWIRRGISSPFQIRSVKSYLSKTVNYILSVRIGLHERKPDENLVDLKQREIGYVLNPKYWGRGLIPEAVNRVIQYGFEILNLDIIWCGHFDSNHNSKRVYEKCGFIYRFQKKQKLKLLNNKEAITLYYSITKSDYIKNIRER
jgi:[ribosomal protein S5]-alanine N-acetyltransferase